MYIYKRVSIVKFVVSHLKAGKREGDPPAAPLPARSELAIIGATRQPGAARRSIVVRIDLMKQHLCDVLYDMCETRRLAEITLTDVAREAGVSRQTLYNHFIDPDDLICYAASRPLYSGAHGFTSLQNAERAYELSLQHKGFFTQLATHASRNSYRASYIKWVERLFGELTIRDDMPENEREFRRLSIAAYASGSIDLYFAWTASDMKVPASTVVRALEEISPAFMLEEQAREREAPDYYPR